MPAFLSVDCGTTVIKATLMDEHCTLIDEEKEGVTVYTPFVGACEADMEEIWRGLCRITGALAQRNPQSMRELACVGVSGQGDGCWPVDREGRPVGRALLWNDTRSKDIDFDAIPGLLEIVSARHTNQVFAGSVGALLTWLKRNQPNDYARVYKALHCKDWLNYNLTGVMRTDRSNASTALYDLVDGGYAVDLLRAMGIPEAIDLLPEVVDSDTTIGTVTPRAALQTGIPAGTRVCEGCIDVCAVALGSDVTRAGRSCAIIGTTLCCELALKKSNIKFQEVRGLVVHHAIRHLFMRLQPTLSGASTLDYAKDMLFPGMGYPELEARLESIPIGSGGLICHPYIRGERAPLKNPFATAGFFGLTAAHTREHMMRAVFEGLACSCYDCYAILDTPYDSIYLSGGASVSPLVCQMFADMLGAPCRRVDVKELGTLGVARLMQVAVGLAADFEAFPDQEHTVFVPDMARHARYMEVYRLFRSLQDSMAEFWKQRTTLV